MPHGKAAIVAGNDEAIASVFLVIHTQDPVFANDWVANARLIAAAPDLLAALKEMLVEFEPPDDYADMSDAVILARAAIEKVEGRAP